MAKKNNDVATSDETDAGAEQAESAGGRPEDSPNMRAVAEAVRRAEEELEKVRLLYQRVKDETADRLEEVGKKRVCEVCDDVAEVVRKFPAASLIVAGLFGFFLGRLFRR